MPRFRVSYRWMTVFLLGAAGLSPAACGGDDDSPTGPKSHGSSSGGTAGGGGEAGGESGTCVDSNGIAEPGELCDGDDLRGVTCDLSGFQIGELRCTANCTFDTSGCSGVEVCQDGKDNDGDSSVDCSDSDCASACADPCATPEVLPDPASTSGDTTGHALFENQCSEPPGGPSTVFKFTASTTGFLDVSATSRTDRDLLVSVRSSCTDAATELACNNVGTGLGISDSLSLPVTQGDTVYLVVSGFDSTQTGAFDLVAKSRQTICGDGIRDPTEECDVLTPGPDSGCSEECHLLVTETEPNGTKATANRYETPFFGAIQPAGDQDWIRVTVPNGPTTLVAETIDIDSAACVGNLLDSVVDIFDDTGKLLDSDDNSGPGLCARAVAPAVPTGTYYVRVSAPALTVTPAFAYRLDVTLVPEVCGDGTVAAGEQCDDSNTAAGDGCSPTCRFELTESEPNNTSARAQSFADPLLAEISPAGDVDFIAVSVPGPSSELNVVLSDNGTGTCVARLMSSYLEILDSNGTQVLASDESGLGECSHASATGLAAGTYFAKVRASDLTPEATFFYRMNVTVF